MLAAKGLQDSVAPTVAIGGLKREGTPVAAHFFRGKSRPPTVFRLRAGRSGDGDRPLAGQPRFVLVPVAALRATLAILGKRKMRSGFVIVRCEQLDLLVEL